MNIPLVTEPLRFITAWRRYGVSMLHEERWLLHSQRIVFIVKMDLFPAYF